MLHKYLAGTRNRADHYGRPRDYSYVLPDPKLLVARRHHVRIWKTGREVDGIPLWVGAATHDVSIEIAMRKLRPFHRIDPNVDAERDFIARSLAEIWQPSRQVYERCTDWTRSQAARSTWFR
jgi:hypothetical protein